MAARHTKEQQTFIVKKLAQFYTVDDICRSFKLRWITTDCKPEDVAATDPQDSVVDPELWALFQRERTIVIETAAALAPTAQRDVRVLVLHRMAEYARERNAISLAAELLEQIAKEQADAYAPKGGGTGKSQETATTEVRSITVTRTIVDPVAPVVA